MLHGRRYAHAGIRLRIHLTIGHPSIYHLSKNSGNNSAQQTIINLFHQAKKIVVS